jgi:hypothetical protein
LEREVALIRESEFSRGYFVGGLGLGDCCCIDDDDDVDRKRKNLKGGGDGRREMGDDDVIDSGASNRIIEKTKKIRAVGNNDDSELSSSSSSSSSPASSPASSLSSPAAWKLEEGAQGGEWYGDRIEILVGSGDVYLQFEDEDDDPFFCSRGLKKEIGFWKFFTRILD